MNYLDNLIEELYSFCIRELSTSIPSNVLLNDDGTPILNEDGSYILTND